MTRTPAPQLPNFFLAGVPKAGTTSLYAYLRQHPQVYLAPLKEPMFFGAADLLSEPYRQQFLRYMSRDPVQLRVYQRDVAERRGKRYTLHWDDYVGLFQNVQNEIAIGEASVDYFWLPSAARSIRQVVPEARLIFILRHPVEKVLSSFSTALKRDPRLRFRAWFQAAQSTESPFWPILDSARYATHLKRFFEQFPRERIRIWLYEAYRSDVRAVLAEIFAFLGVAADVPIDTSRRHNEGVAPRSPLLHQLRRRILGDRRPTLPFPEPVRRIMRQLYYRPRGVSHIDSADRRMVIDYYADEVARTGALIERDLSAWLR